MLLLFPGTALAEPLAPATIDQIALIAPTSPPRLPDGFVETMERIAYCESRNVATAKNPGSSASGRYQFLKGSWEYYGQKYWGNDFAEKDVFNYDHNTELAYWVAQQNPGFTDWLESAHCWK